MNQKDKNITEELTEDTASKKKGKSATEETALAMPIAEETNFSLVEEEQEQENKEGVYVHTFKTPFEDSGEVYEEIEFDFNALTGADMIKVENEMKLKGIFGEMLEVSKVYQSHIAIRAAAKGKHKTIITADALERMPVKDFFKITNQVRDFLIATGG